MTALYSWARAIAQSKSPQLIYLVLRTKMKAPIKPNAMPIQDGHQWKAIETDNPRRPTHTPTTMTLIQVRLDTCPSPIGPRNRPENIDGKARLRTVILIGVSFGDWCEESPPEPFS